MERRAASFARMAVLRSVSIRWVNMPAKVGGPRARCQSWLAGQVGWPAPDRSVGDGQRDDEDGAANFWALDEHVLCLTDRELFLPHDQGSAGVHLDIQRVFFVNRGFRVDEQGKTFADIEGGQLRALQLLLVVAELLVALVAKHLL